jgi:hypothetical protein
MQAIQNHVGMRDFTEALRHGRPCHGREKAFAPSMSGREKGLQTRTGQTGPQQQTVEDRIVHNEESTDHGRKIREQDGPGAGDRAVFTPP